MGKKENNKLDVFWLLRFWFELGRGDLGKQEKWRIICLRWWGAYV